MDTITVRFSAQRKLLSLLIRWWTFSPFSHVEFITPEGLTLGSRFPSGVQLREPIAYSICADIEIPITEDSYRDILKSIGTPYDFLSLLSFPFRVAAQKTSWLTCIEFVAEKLSKHGVVHIPDTHNITPYHLYLILLNVRGK